MPHRRLTHLMPDTPTILLKTGWDTGNIGDIGITPGTLAVLEHHLPDVRVIAWMTRMDDAVEAMLRRRFADLSIVRGAIDGDHEPNTDELRRAFDAADLVLHNSSMNENPSMMRAAAKRGKPYGMFGQSYFPRIVEQPEVMAALNDARFVFCRDTLTLATLRDAGLNAPVLDFNPDGCFGFDLRDDAAAERFLREHDLKPGAFMTVQLRTQTAKPHGPDNRPDLAERKEAARRAATDPAADTGHDTVFSQLNPEHPTPAQQADDERRAAVLRDVMTGWIQQTGGKVLIAPEVKKEIEHNRRLLFDPLPADLKPQVVVRERFWNADEAASVFAHASVVLCHEPHACIIALARGTPIIHAYSAFHSPKYHMFADIGLSEWLPSLDDTPPGDLLERMLTIHADPDAARRKVRQAMSFVHQRFADNCRIIQQALAP